MARVDPLARRDRQVDLRRRLRQRVEVVRRHRLFEPGGLERLKIVGEIDSRRGAEAAVHLDQDFDVGPHGGPDGFDQPDRAVLRGAVHLVEARTERIDLQRLVPAGDDLLRRQVERLGRAFDRVPAVRVGLDLVAHRAAEELVDRQADLLSDNVPAGHLDECDAGAGDVVHSEEVVDEGPLHELLDVERIGAQHVALLDLLEVGEHRVGADRADFRDADQTLVGLHLEIGEVAPGRPEDHRGQLRDLHPNPSFRGRES